MSGIVKKNLVSTGYKKEKKSTTLRTDNWKT